MQKIVLEKEIRTAFSASKWSFQGPVQGMKQWLGNVSMGGMGDGYSILISEDDGRR